MKPDSENWDRLQALFHLVEHASPADRDRMLEEACPDPELRARVIAISRGAVHSAAPPPGPAPAPAPAQPKLGPYTLIRRLGSGGMGAVYLVERDAGGVLQRAALKVLAPHAIGPSFVERFHKEQRILASLDHPNITRMLDAGLGGDGQPYLVMEYVEGEPLDTWCDARTLTIDERIELFLKICHAVDYAHRNLVVHLDLKPSNILITTDGAPKLLDFGTSKLLHADGMFTTTIPVTPSYGSPEQLRNEPVTTACDVYSLGVILHELLAGERPGGESSVAALIARAVTRQEHGPIDRTVTRESAGKRRTTEARLRTLLSGDLSTIVRKCLSPQPLDRYASVNALAEDLQRYLEGRPVLAQRQTMLYQMSKFVRRNQGKVAMSLLMLIALTASLGYAWWGQQQALREGQRALRMQTFLYRLFKLANSNITGKPAATVKDFLQLGIKVLPEYIKDPADLRQAQLALAESMFWNGDLSDAQVVYQQVAKTSEAAADPASEAEARLYLGDIARQEGRAGDALSYTARALDLSRRAGVPPRTRVLSAGSYALAREVLGRYTDEDLQLWQYAVQEAQTHHFPPHEIGEAQAYLAAALRNRGRLDEAERQYEQALATNRQDPVAVCNQINVLVGLATVRQLQARFEESAKLYAQAYQTSVTCNGVDDRATLDDGMYWAGALVRTGRASEAIPMLEKALPLWRKSYPAGSASLTPELYYLGLAYLETGNLPAALPNATEALAVLESVRNQMPSDDYRYGWTHLLLARVLTAQRKYSAALPHAEAAVRILTKDPRTPLAKLEAARSQALLTDLHRQAAASTGQYISQ